MKQTELVKLIMEAIGEDDQPPMAEAPESQSKWAFPAKQAPAALAKAKISGAFRVLEQHRDEIQKLKERVTQRVKKQLGPAIEVRPVVGGRTYGQGSSVRKRGVRIIDLYVDFPDQPTFQARYKDARIKNYRINLLLDTESLNRDFTLTPGMKVIVVGYSTEPVTVYNDGLGGHTVRITLLNNELGDDI